MVAAWERQKGETSKAFNRFLVYRNFAPENRSLGNVHKYLKSQNTEGKDPTLSSIENMSSRWNWDERARLYDLNVNLEEKLANDSDFKSVNGDNKELWKKYLGFADTVADDIIKNENNYALSTLVGLFNNLVNSTDRIHHNLRLAYGRSTNINETSVDAVLDANVEAEVENKNITTLSDKELEDLLTINDKQEEFIDEL